MAELARVADGSWFTDERSPHRNLRVNVHDEDGLVVLTTWRNNRCIGSIRLTMGEAGRLAQALVGGLTDAATRAPARSPSRSRTPRWLTRWLTRIRRPLGSVVGLDACR